MCMTDNVVINKCEIIERCIKRVREIYGEYSKNFDDNFNMQDALILNLQRACEASIDLATHMVRIKKLGVPKNSRESFELLAKNKLIPQELSQKLVGMVGFRNISVHNYQEIDLELVKDVAKKHYKDILVYTKIALQDFA